MPENAEMTFTSVDDAMNAVVNGIKDLYGSEKFRAYANILKLFHDYSTNNQILIVQQMPEATQVMGYWGWRNLNSQTDSMVAEKITNQIREQGHIPEGDEIEQINQEAHRINEFFKTHVPDKYYHTVNSEFNFGGVEYNTSIDRANRWVRKGQHGIKIIACEKETHKVQRERIDSNTGEVVRNPDGSPQMETVTEVTPRYKIVTVFDISQTDGTPLLERPEAVQLTASVDNYRTILDAVMGLSPVPVRFGPIEGTPNGYYDATDKEIVVREGMPEAQTIKTLIHEIAHATIHDRDRTGHTTDQSSREVQAEVIACVVASYLGIDTFEYTVPYVAAWSSDKEDMRELKASSSIIRETSHNFIRMLSSSLGQDLDLESPEEQQEEAVEEPAQEIIADDERETSNVGDDPASDDVSADQEITNEERNRLFADNNPGMTIINRDEALNIWDDPNLYIPIIYSVSDDGARLPVRNRHDIETAAHDFAVDTESYNKFHDLYGFTEPVVTILSSDNSSVVEAGQTLSLPEANRILMEADGAYRASDRATEHVEYQIDCIRNGERESFRGTYDLGASGSTLSRDYFLENYARNEAMRGQTDPIAIDRENARFETIESYMDFQTQLSSLRGEIRDHLDVEVSPVVRGYYQNMDEFIRNAQVCVNNNEPLRQVESLADLGLPDASQDIVDFHTRLTGAILTGAEENNIDLTGSREVVALYRDDREDPIDITVTSENEGYFVHYGRNQETSQDIVMTGPFRTLEDATVDIIATRPGAVDITNTLEDKNNRDYGRAELFGIPVLFSENHIDPSEVPDGMYRYDFRALEPEGVPSTLEENVEDYDYAGTILSPVELPFIGKDTVRLELGDNFERQDGVVSANEFLSEQENIQDSLAAMNRDILESNENIILNPNRGNEAATETLYAIYQIRNNDAPYRFTGMDEVNEFGMQVRGNDYQLVYASTEFPRDSLLEDIYLRFNADDRPEGFNGHSLSTSDVVVLNGANGPEAHYVDDIGYVDLPNFVHEREEIEEAKQVIQAYVDEEFEGESNVSFDDLAHIPLAFSETPDEGIPIQAEADLVHLQINKYLTDFVGPDDIPDETEQFDSLRDMIDRGLVNLSFADLTSITNEDREEELGEDEPDLNDPELDSSEPDDPDIDDPDDSDDPDGSDDSSDDSDDPDDPDGPDNDEPDDPDDSDINGQVPVYHESLQYALDNNEMDQYDASRTANIECAHAIESAIDENYDESRLDPAGARNVIEQFGPDRVEYVLAMSVLSRSEDGRIIPPNRDWAHSVISDYEFGQEEPGRYNAFVVNSHGALLDGFIRQSRDEIDRVRAERETNVQRITQAMSVAGYEYNDFESDDGHIVFEGDPESGRLSFKNWDEVASWLDNVDLSYMENEEDVYMILHPENYEDTINLYMRSMERAGFELDESYTDGLAFKTDDPDVHDVYANNWVDIRDYLENPDNFIDPECWFDIQEILGNFEQEEEIEDEPFIIDENSTDVEINGYEGTWHAVDSTEYNGKEYFLMLPDSEDQDFQLVVDRDGNAAVYGEISGFTDDIYDLIDKYENSDIEEWPDLNIDENSTDIELKEYVGTWHTIDSVERNGKDYFLLAHDGDSDSIFNVLVDTKGNLVIFDIDEGIDDEILSLIDEYESEPDPEEENIDDEDLDDEEEDIDDIDDIDDSLDDVEVYPRETVVAPEVLEHISIEEESQRTVTEDKIAREEDKLSVVIEGFATELDEFSSRADLDEYSDRVADFVMNVDEIVENVEAGDTDHIKEWLDEIIMDEGPNAEEADRLQDALYSIEETQAQIEKERGLVASVETVQVGQEEMTVAAKYVYENEDGDPSHDIITVQSDNGFYNQYMVSENQPQGEFQTGPFETLDEAKADVNEHESSAQEISMYDTFVPLYPFTAEHAEENKETVQYNDSVQANMECKAAIEDVIHDTYMNDDKSGRKEAIKELVDQYGPERVEYVLANTVDKTGNGSAISPGNKEWAANVKDRKALDLDFSDQPGLFSDKAAYGCVVNGPSNILNSLITDARVGVLDYNHEQLQQQPEISFFVAENARFSAFGKYVDNLTMEEALNQYKELPSEMGKGIGFVLKDGGPLDGTPFTLVIGDTVIDYSHIDAIQDYLSNSLVQDAMNEIKEAFSDVGNKKKTGQDVNDDMTDPSKMEDSMPRHRLHKINSVAL